MKAGIKPLTTEQQTQLLSSRLEGRMGFSFRPFSSLFRAISQTHLGYCVALMTSSHEIAETELQTPFPNFYKPTLREFLDAIALQTFSRWKYDPTDKYLKDDGTLERPAEGIAIFEFTRTVREKPFEITLATGWNRIDNGNWLMLVPPDFPVGMDIYEMGTYSSDDCAAEKDLLKRVPTEVALESAKRAHKDAGREDLKPCEVGPYEALFFETMVPSRLGGEVRWRQWVFMVDNRCYFVVSTIAPEYEEKILPDVEKMLASFRAKK